MASNSETGARLAASEVELRAARSALVEAASAATAEKERLKEDALQAASAAAAEKERFVEEALEAALECDSLRAMTEAITLQMREAEESWAAERAAIDADTRQASGAAAEARAAEAAAVQRAAEAHRALEAERLQVQALRASSLEAAAELASERAAARAAAASLSAERAGVAAAREAERARWNAAASDAACDAAAAAAAAQRMLELQARDAAAAAAAAASELAVACSERDDATQAVKQLRGDADSLALLPLSALEDLHLLLEVSTSAVRRAVLAAEVDARSAEASAEAAACPVCLLAPRDTSLNCGHCTCAACAALLTRCPLCRVPVSTRARVFI